MSRRPPPALPWAVLKQMFPCGPWIALYESPDPAAMRRQYDHGRRLLKPGQTLALMEGERIVAQHRHQNHHQEVV
jgi:hypothetical protein